MYSIYIYVLHVVDANHARNYTLARSACEKLIALLVTDEMYLRLR